MSAIFGVPVDAAYYLVSVLTVILAPVAGGLAAVAAIIAVTMAVRALLMPLSLRALREQAVAARLAPELTALRQRYAKQPEKLQSEMSALYRREGTSMFAGITPLLIQWPFLSVMYVLFRSPRVAGKANTLLTHDLFGVPLGTHWLSGAGPASLHGVVFAGLFVLLAGLCWLTARLARLTAAQAASGTGATGGTGAAGAARATGATGKTGAAGAAGAATGTGAGVGSGVLAKVLPYLTVVIAAFAPLAAGIYLLTSLAWSLAERALFLRRSRGVREPALTK